MCVVIRFPNFKSCIKILLGLFDCQIVNLDRKNATYVTMQLHICSYVHCLARHECIILLFVQANSNILSHVIYVGI